MGDFRFSALSLQRLSGVSTQLVNVVHRALELSQVDFMVVEGFRTMTRQRELYAQGRTEPGKIVTWTLQSKHCQGKAVDLAPWVGGKICWDLDKMRLVKDAMFAAAQEQGVRIRWGRDWNQNGVEGEKGEYDGPHFELVD